MNPQELDAIEKELLEIIAQHLKDNKIEVDKAQQLAKDFLAVLPVQNRQDLLTKLKTLSDTYEEVKEVYIQESTKDNTIKEQEALATMSAAIKQGKIEHALTVAKKLKEDTQQ